MFKSITANYSDIHWLHCYIVDDNFTDNCEVKVESFNKRYISTHDEIVAETKSIIRIYTQHQENVAKNIWLFFRDEEFRHAYNPYAYSTNRLIELNKERNLSYAYHAKEVDKLWEKYSVLL